MDIQLNTLYIFTAGTYLRRDHQTVVIEIEKKVVRTVPIHHLDGIAVFGPVLVSHGVVELCAESGVALTYLQESGRLIARIDAPVRATCCCAASSSVAPIGRRRAPCSRVPSWRGSCTTAATPSFGRPASRATTTIVPRSNRPPPGWDSTLRTWPARRRATRSAAMREMEHGSTSRSCPA